MLIVGRSFSYKWSSRKFIGENKGEIEKKMIILSVFFIDSGIFDFEVEFSVI